MAKRFRNHNPNQYVLLFLFFISDNASKLNNVVYKKLTLYYKPKMQIGYIYAKILLTTKMIQHSKSMQKRHVETEPLADARGALGVPRNPG